MTGNSFGIDCMHKSCCVLHVVCYAPDIGPTGLDVSQLMKFIVAKMHSEVVILQKSYD